VVVVVLRKYHHFEAGFLEAICHPHPPSWHRPY
jgi:hypothetical protein